ncbi:MAG: hypothetical protein AB7I41_09395 [Candidatus Sericytochromatia bacterium]
MHSLLLCLALMLSTQAASAEELIFRSEQAQSDPQLKQIELQGQVQLFLGNYRILAEHLHWDKASQTLSASGQVELVSPEWELKADHVQLNLQGQTIQAEQGQLSYQGLVLRFEKAELNVFNWQLSGVRLNVPGIPGEIEAKQVLLYPELSSENVQLTQPRWSLLPLTLPSLNLSLPWGDPPPELASELRSQTGWFSPSLNLLEGGLALGSTTRLFQDASQRLYARLDYHPVQGGLAGLSHEWRPQSLNGVLNSEILAQSASETPHQIPLRGHLEWQGGLWGKNRLRAGIFLQEPSGFFGRLMLPPLKNSLQPLAWHSEALLLSDWLSLPVLRLRSLWGARVTGTNWHGAGSLQAISRPWIPLPGVGFQASGVLNGLIGESGQALTGGLRLLSEWEAQPNWIVGAYGEQYLSGLPVNIFAQESWLLPRSGVYTIWKILPELALGGRVEWVLPAQGLSAAETLLSWRQGIWVLNLLVQGIPPGMQVQVQTGVF